MEGGAKLLGHPVFISKILVIFSAPGTCEEGWSLHEQSGNCYKVFEGNHNWEQARTLCMENARQGGAEAKLAEIMDQSQVEF